MYLTIDDNESDHNCVNLPFLLSYLFIKQLACAQLIALCRLPESPKWLASRGKLDDARRALRRLFNIRSQFRNSVYPPHLRNATSREKVGTLKEVLRKKVSSEKYPNENNTASVGDLQGNKKKGYASSTEIGTGEDDKLLISSSNIQPFQRLANIPIVIVEGIFAQGRTATMRVTKAGRISFSSFRKWRPVVSLISSLCTASHSCCALELLYWENRITGALAVSSHTMGLAVTAALVISSATIVILVADDKCGRLPYVVGSSSLLVGGGCLSALLLIGISMASHEFGSVIHWLAPPCLFAITSSIAGWQALVFTLLPLLVCEITPTSVRVRAMALLTATSAVYAPLTLYGFSHSQYTMPMSNKSMGPPLLLYGCTAGTVLIFLVRKLLVETARKGPEQIRREIVNRAGYVLFQVANSCSCNEQSLSILRSSYHPIDNEGIGHDRTDAPGHFGTDELNGDVAGAIGSGSPSSMALNILNFMLSGGHIGGVVSISHCNGMTETKEDTCRIDV